MEWFTQIVPTLTGLPWYAVAGIVLLSIVCTKGVDGLLKLRRSFFEERKYMDERNEGEHSALVAELKDRIEKLEKAFEANVTRLEASQAAHVKCEIEQAALRGQLGIQAEQIKRMEFQLSRLWAHDEANQENVKQLKQAVDEVKPG